jgi:hypothetical protein
MIAVAIVFLLFIALGLATRRWGSDTRAGRDWEPLDARLQPCRSGSILR